MDELRELRIHAPAATHVAVFVCSGGAPNETTMAVARPDGDGWVAQFRAAVGDHYWIQVDDGPPLLDPSCHDLLVTRDGPRSVVRDAWGRHPQGAPLTAGPVVYELHVRGFGGSFRGCIERLDHVVGLGANVLELMPVHPSDPADNYWGYMPLVWGAVHRPYAAEPHRAAEELAELVAAAHERGLHVTGQGRHPLHGAGPSSPREDEALSQDHLWDQRAPVGLPLLPRGALEAWSRLAVLR